jgi:hypothetical protein
VEAAADHNAKVVVGVGGVGVGRGRTKGMRVTSAREVVRKMTVGVGVAWVC